MMDRDHVEITGMVLELNDQALGGTPWDPAGRTLRELIRAMVSYFSLEQAMMDMAEYPQAAIHRLRHEWMIDQMRVLLAHSRESGLTENEPLLELLSESHYAHMHTEDLRFGLWMNAEPARRAGAAAGIVRVQRKRAGMPPGEARAPRPLVYVERSDARPLPPLVYIERADRELAGSSLPVIER